MSSSVWGSFKAGPKFQEIIHYHASVNVGLGSSRADPVVDASIDTVVVDCVSRAEPAGVVDHRPVRNAPVWSHPVPTETGVRIEDGRFNKVARVYSFIPVSMDDYC